MRTFAQKPEATRQAFAANAAVLAGRQFGPAPKPNATRLQRAVGIQSSQCLPQARGGESGVGLTDVAWTGAGHDTAGISVPAQAASAESVAPTIADRDDPYETEADRVSAQVMGMEAPEVAPRAPPAIHRLGAAAPGGGAATILERRCAACQEPELQWKAPPSATVAGEHPPSRQAAEKVAAVQGGQALTNAQRAFFEPRFGVDFSSVRIHADDSADSAARAVGALAYTRRSDIVFRRDQYRPDTGVGRQLLAHELTHVVQQGAAPGIRHPPARTGGESSARIGAVRGDLAGQVLQRWPGDGMLPPGDCHWANYIVLRGGVETAKAIVSTLGACRAADNCLTLATKIAAVSAEIAARVALDATCFRGGDTGHREQVQVKLNMLKNCFEFFDEANCPTALIAAMALVVERAREVIAAAAAAVALALVVALIAAIVLLIDAIAAAAAAVAAGAAAAAAAAGVMAVLVLLRDEVPPEEPPTA